jgi:hypothetical protein
VGVQRHSGRLVGDQFVLADDPHLDVETLATHDNKVLSAERLFPVLAVSHHGLGGVSLGDAGTPVDGNLAVQALVLLLLDLGLEVVHTEPIHFISDVVVHHQVVRILAVPLHTLLAPAAVPSGFAQVPVEILLTHRQVAIAARAQVSRSHFEKFEKWRFFFYFI